MAEGSGFSKGMGFGCGCVAAIVLALIAIPVACFVVGMLGVRPDLPTHTTEWGDRTEQLYVQEAVNVRRGAGV